MVRLYRGVCNTFETLQILQNHTAGGQTDFEPAGTGILLQSSANRARGQTLFRDLNMTTADHYMKCQREAYSERVPKIVNIPPLRPLIEYTYSYRIANSFGLLGLLIIIIDEKFIEPGIPSSEGGVFCISNADIQEVTFVLSKCNNYGENRSMRNYFVNILRDFGMTLNSDGAYTWP